MSFSCSCIVINWTNDFCNFQTCNLHLSFTSEFNLNESDTWNGKTFHSPAGLRQDSVDCPLIQKYRLFIYLFHNCTWEKTARCKYEAGISQSSHLGWTNIYIYIKWETSSFIISECSLCGTNVTPAISCQTLHKWQYVLVCWCCIIDQRMVIILILIQFIHKNSFLPF